MLDNEDFAFSYGEFVNVVDGKHKGKSGMVYEVIRDVIDLDDLMAWIWTYKVRTYDGEIIFVSEDEIELDEAE